MTGSAIAATLFGPEDLRVIEQRMSLLPPGMVRVRFGAGGICGSDLHYFRHARTGDFVVTSPLVLGHEIAGEIVEINGSELGLSVGERVAINPSRWCGHCPRCLEGRANLCENIYFMGSASKTPHMQGGFSSLFDATPAQCTKVPPHVPYQALALAEPLAVSLHAVERAGGIEGSTVILFGAGPIGLLTLLAARLAGCDDISVADIAAAPLAFAKKLGADRTIDLSAGADELTTTRHRETLGRRFRDFWHSRWPWLGDCQRQARGHCCSGGQSSRRPDFRASQRGDGEGNRPERHVPIRHGVQPGGRPYRPRGNRCPQTGDG